MKKMNKALSFLLVLSILCTIFAVPASAVTYSTENNTELTSIIADKGQFTCEGTVTFSSNSLEYEISCRNDLGPEDIYDIYAQCVIFYSDDNYDFSYVRNNPGIGRGNTERYGGTMYFAANKTVIGFDAEFRLSFQGEAVWGAILAAPSTLGINA